MDEYRVVFVVEGEVGAIIGKCKSMTSDDKYDYYNKCNFNPNVIIDQTKELMIMDSSNKIIFPDDLVITEEFEVHNLADVPIKLNLDEANTKTLLISKADQFGKIRNNLKINTNMHVYNMMGDGQDYQYQWKYIKNDSEEISELYSLSSLNQRKSGKVGTKDLWFRILKNGKFTQWSRVQKITVT